MTEFNKKIDSMIITRLDDEINIASNIEIIQSRIRIDQATPRSCTNVSREWRHLLRRQQRQRATRHGHERRRDTHGEASATRITAGREDHEDRLRRESQRYTYR